jgi:predicted RNase H-like nuclease
MAARVQFDATELIERLDELLVDVRELRERVHELAEVVGNGDGAPGDNAKKKKKKHKGKKQREAVEGL